MIKIIWVFSLIMALAAYALFPLGCKRLPAAVGVVIFYFLAMAGVAVIILLLMGGTFYL